MSPVDDRGRSTAVQVDRLTRAEGDHQPRQLPELKSRVDAGAAPVAAHRQQLTVADAERAARVATDGDVRVELPGARREPLAIGAVNHRPAIVYEQRAGLQEVTGRRVGKLASRISLRTGVPVAPARARDLKEVARERVTRLPGGALENDNVALHQRCGAP